MGAVTCPQEPLAPGASVTCTADEPYVVTAADQSAGVVHNEATVDGEYCPIPMPDPAQRTAKLTTTAAAVDPACSAVTDDAVLDVPVAGALARTGADGLQLFAGVGALLVLTGLGLVVGRRRSTARHGH